MATFKEIEAYYRSLDDAYKSGQESNRFNTDRSHNATIFRFMLDKSEHIYMFCGELSVLRHSFAKYVKEDCGPADGEKGMRRMYDSLACFLSDEKKTLHIILENDISSDHKGHFVDDLVTKELFMKALKKGQIELNALGDNLTSKEGLSHFTYTDTQIVRIEQDKVEHSAICTMNDARYYHQIKTIYSNLSRFAVPVQLV